MWFRQRRHFSHWKIANLACVHSHTAVYVFHVFWKFVKIYYMEDSSNLFNNFNGLFTALELTDKTCILKYGGSNGKRDLNLQCLYSLYKAIVKRPFSLDVSSSTDRFCMIRGICKSQRLFSVSRLFR